MPTSLQKPSNRIEAFTLIAQNLSHDPEAIRNAGLTPAGEQPNSEPIPPEYWNSLAQYLGPFFFAVQAAHNQARAILEQAGCSDEERDAFVGNGFSTGSSVTANFLGHAVLSCCKPEAQASIGELTPATLAPILHRSYPSLAKFGATRHYYNGNLERLYDIRATRDEAGFSVQSGFIPPRGFSLQTIGMSGHRVVPDGWEQSCQDVTNRPDNTSARRELFVGTPKCPALNILTPAMYHWMVDFGCATEEIVPAIIQEQAVLASQEPLVKQ